MHVESAKRMVEEVEEGRHLLQLSAGNMTRKAEGMNLGTTNNSGRALCNRQTGRKKGFGGRALTLGTATERVRGLPNTPRELDGRRDLY